MKKLFVMFTGLFILAACQQQQPDPAVEEKPAQETQAQQAPKVDEKWLSYEVFDTNSMPDNTPMPAVLIAEQEQPCAIKGYDCREVIAKLTLTTEEPANEEIANGETPYWNVPGGTKYVNPALDEMGMKITQYVMYRDGGTTQYVIDDNVGIHTNLRLGDNPDYGKVTVKFKASGSLEIIWHLFRWGDNVKIISPKSLKQEYINWLEKCLEAERG